MIEKLNEATLLEDECSQKMKKNLNTRAVRAAEIQADGQAEWGGKQREPTINSTSSPTQVKDKTEKKEIDLIRESLLEVMEEIRAERRAERAEMAELRKWLKLRCKLVLLDLNEQQLECATHANNRGLKLAASISLSVAKEVISLEGAWGRHSNREQGLHRQVRNLAVPIICPHETG